MKVSVSPIFVMLQPTPVINNETYKLIEFKDFKNCRINEEFNIYLLWELGILILFTLHLQFFFFLCLKLFLFYFILISRL